MSVYFSNLDTQSVRFAPVCVLQVVLCSLRMSCVHFTLFTMDVFRFSPMDVLRFSPA